MLVSVGRVFIQYRGKLWLSDKRSSIARAFSISELIVVIAIIGIVAAVGAPRYYNSLVQYRVTNAANRLQADLTLARQVAIRRSRSFPVSFITGAASSYTIVGMRDPDAEVATDYTVSLVADPYRATISALSVGGDDRVIFDGWGVPDSAASITLKVGSVTRTVTVAAVTGEIQVTTP